MDPIYNMKKGIYDYLMSIKKDPKLIEELKVANSLYIEIIKLNDDASMNSLWLNFQSSISSLIFLLVCSCSVFNSFATLSNSANRFNSAFHTEISFIISLILFSISIHFSSNIE